MDYTSLSFGLVAVLLGLYTGYLRLTDKLQDSEKLKQMKIRFGESTGNILHLLFYTILPISGGITITFYTLILN
jgi:hypothetical protein